MGVSKKIGVPQNGWFVMESPIKMDDLGVPLFLETPIYYSLEVFGFLPGERFSKMSKSVGHMGEIYIIHSLKLKVRP